MHLLLTDFTLLYLQTREERKMEAIMKAFERLEKAEQRRQENQAKQAHRKEHQHDASNSGTQKKEPVLDTKKVSGEVRDEGPRRHGASVTKSSATDRPRRKRYFGKSVDTFPLSLFFTLLGLFDKDIETRIFQSFLRSPSLSSHFNVSIFLISPGSQSFSVFFLIFSIHKICSL
jgi:hypothetical protein